MDAVSYTHLTAKWQSDTFRKEASKYFDLPHLIAYYLYVQFNRGVDQLAKNILIRTWDGVKWLIDYYDCLLYTSYLLGVIFRYPLCASQLFILICCAGVPSVFFQTSKARPLRGV